MGAAGSPTGLFHLMNIAIYECFAIYPLQKVRPVLWVIIHQWPLASLYPYLNNYQKEHYNYCPVILVLNQSTGKEGQIVYILLCGSNIFGSNASNCNI